MKERPILFSGSMVRAIRDDRKTQTRRVVKPTQSMPKVAPVHMEPWIIEGEWQTDDDGLPCWSGFHPDYPGEAKWFSCPYGGTGDRLWVRETWRADYEHGENTRGEVPPWVEYRADTNNHGPADGSADTESPKWKPSIFMPRWASRFLLEIVDIKVERLHHIGELSAKAEGVEPKPVVSVARGESYLSYCEAFSDLWDSINARRGYSWETNPWVWCVSFRRIV